jgi:predicted DNA repair protein MutK
LQRAAGRGLLSFAPWLMKALSVIGTAAMFMVGGGILLHGIHPLQLAVEGWAAQLAELALAGPLLSLLAPTLAGMVFGVVAGALALGVMQVFKRFRAQ